MPGLLSSFFERSSKRRVYADLLKLDDHLLRDIGLTRADIRAAMVTRSVASLTSVHAHG
jgi:uncharacterized protein YjiS (DUF1127 family)